MLIVTHRLRRGRGSLLQAVAILAVLVAGACGAAPPTGAGVSVSISPSAKTTSVPSQAPTLARSLGGVSLGMTDSEVVAAHGDPQTRTVSHGLGTPQWEYADGLTVFLRVPVTGTSTLAVWRLLIQRPFVGGTVEGFRLGDTEDTFRQKYLALAILAPDASQLLVRDKDGVQLAAIFDHGAATIVTLDVP